MTVRAGTTGRLIIVCSNRKHESWNHAGARLVIRQARVRALTAPPRYSFSVLPSVVDYLSALDLLVMGVVKVSTEGLERLAARCDGMATELATPAAPSSAGEMWQPSVAAVSSVNTSINGTAHVLAARLNSTAVKLTESAAGYTAQDETSGSDISSIVV